MRCSHLAEVWQDHGKVTLHGVVDIAFATERLATLGVTCDESSPASDSSAVLICDSYDERVRRECSSASAALRVMVDDVGNAIPDGFDLVWNPNAYDTNGLYVGFKGAVIGGPSHVPSRADIPKWQAAGVSATAIMLGGGTPPARLVLALERMSGGNARHEYSAAGSWAPPGWHSISPIDPWPDVTRHGRLITAAGTTVWEAARSGIPVIVVKTAANQDLIFQWAVENGAPGVDATAELDVATMTAMLLHALSRAAPLPYVPNGAPAVRDVFLAMAVRPT